MTYLYLSAIRLSASVAQLYNILVSDLPSLRFLHYTSGQFLPVLSLFFLSFLLIGKKCNQGFLIAARFGSGRSPKRPGPIFLYASPKDCVFYMLMFHCANRLKGG